MRPTIYPIDRPGPGRLSTMARPLGGDRLAGELAGLRDEGTTILVSALTEPERVELDLVTEDEAVRAAGLEFVALPVPDFGVPEPAAALATLRELVARLRGGAHIVVHCWAGIGRSSTLVAGILVLDGVPPDLAWRLITRARGHRVPESDAQRHWPEELLELAGQS